MGRLSGFTGFFKRCWSDRTLCILLAIAYMALLVPLLWAGTYTVAHSDDLVYGAPTHHAWVETGSLSAVLRAAAQETQRVYQQWQGTFTALFLMALQPAVFGDGFYAITPFLMVGALTAGTLLFCRAFFHRLFGASRTQARIVALVWLIVCTQMMPSTREGLYWYNGALYYTLYYAVALCMFALMLLAILEKRTGQRRAYALLCCLLAAFIGGGNYPTALLCTLVLALTTAFLAMLKNARWRSVLPALIVLACSFAVSIVAPGNAVRKAQFRDIGAVAAILKALYRAFGVIGEWTTFPVLITLAALCPVLWSMAKKSALSFRYPVLVGVLSYGLFAAQFCPTFYAMDNPGAGRLHNILFYSYYFLVTFNIFYCMGWAQRRYEIRLRVGRAAYGGGYPWVLACGLCLALAVSCYFLRADMTLTSVEASRILLRGEAQQFGRETQARQALLNDPTLESVELEAYTDFPELLFDDKGIMVEPGETRRSETLENYYQKESVIIRG